VAVGGNPLLHFIRRGAEERRDPCEGFSTDWYLEKNPDVAASGENPLAHYLREGRRAGRIPVDPDASYRVRVLNERQQLTFEVDEIKRHIEVMLHRPRFLIHLEDGPAEPRWRTLASLDAQLYPDHVPFDASRLGDLREKTGKRIDRFLVWLEAGDELDQRALYEFARAINTDPFVDIVYSDEDEIEGGVRVRPFFKPDWSPDTLESFNYIGPAGCFRGTLAAELWPKAQGFYDFVLQATEANRRIRHVRQILCHRGRSAIRPKQEQSLLTEVRALKGRLARTSRAGEIAPVASGLGCYTVKLRLLLQPIVSLIIPTAGREITRGTRQIDLITNCLDAIAKRSSYKQLEYIIVHNGDLGARADALRERGCNLITYDQCTFNLARKLNLGASIASGEMLLLLHDDIEPLRPDWIERLLDQLEKPHVGVVGAKLVSVNDMTQHVGIVLNHGDPNHVRQRRPKDEAGYFFSTCAVRNYSAVSGACMMTRASLYRAVGGYNEALAVTLNDVDYCLKVRERGLTAVYTPLAELMHYESRSHAVRSDADEISLFAERWAAMTISDPFYNEDALTLSPPTFDVGRNPRLI
jgi:GT2 family glycosyltransferase